MGPTWGPPGTCRPQMDPMLAPWTLLWRKRNIAIACEATRKQREYIKWIYCCLYTCIVDLKRHQYQRLFHSHLHSPLNIQTLKVKCLHLEEILIIGCTGSCHSDNSQCNQWWKFPQDHISVLANYLLVWLCKGIDDGFWKKGYTLRSYEPRTYCNLPQIYSKFKQAQCNYLSVSWIVYQFCYSRCFKWLRGLILVTDTCHQVTPRALKMY